MTRGFGVRPSARQIERQRQANEACRRARAEYGVAWKPQVTCMARSCSAPIGRGMLFCKPHWLSLPVDIRRPAQQPAEEVKASPPPPPNFASPAGEKIRSGKDDVKAIGPDGPSQRKPVGAAVPSSPDRAEKPVATRTETSMPKPPQASAATSALSCPPRAEVAPLPKKPVMGWVERQMAEVAAAKAYLERRGFAVTRADRDAQIARWFLSGWRWPLTNSELIEAARRARAQEARA
ncbi:MAG: hypothetical protein DI623_13710 [Sphingomonas sanxanigenens]|uniref:Uncharacterized protein n=1 Tax=Sphingomonas sanxanigenens TaxID=397260 RepID=A0A2W5A021_9SPHN|nr:MAG: hypothetical protein DI623_13710 [Sphingomonas sanxanigenens]